MITPHHFITGRAKTAGIFGWPVGHSKSPALHGFWLREYNIDGAYVPMAVKPDDLATALRALPALGFAGVNLTVPHKEAAMGLVDDISDVAKSVGAINTIFVRPGGRLYGTNTDAYGFIENIRHASPGFDAKSGPCVVLGAGGAARAVCAALIAAGCGEIRLINRTPARSQALANDFAPVVKAFAWQGLGAALADAAMLVNATTLGMTGQPVLQVDLTPLPKTALVTDLVYAPVETALLTQAKQRGNPTVDGVGMLLYQAQAGFEGWFGVKPAVTAALRAHVLAAS
jgi:shikimate dehydrogenase